MKSDCSCFFVTSTLIFFLKLVLYTRKSFVRIYMLYMNHEAQNLLKIKNYRKINSGSYLFSVSTFEILVHMLQQFLKLATVLHPILLPVSIVLHTIVVPVSIVLHTIVVPVSIVRYTIVVPVSIVLHAIVIPVSIVIHTILVPVSFDYTLFL